MIHKGPYETISQAYAKFGEYMAKKGYEYAGAPMELYLSDPQKTPPDEIMTEMQVPVRE
jgi:effector-binding domain-containing protein